MQKGFDISPTSKKLYITFITYLIMIAILYILLPLLFPRNIFTPHGVAHSTFVNIGLILTFIVATRCASTLFIHALLLMNWLLRQILPEHSGMQRFLRHLGVIYFLIRHFGMSVWLGFSIAAMITGLINIMDKSLAAWKESISTLLLVGLLVSLFSLSPWL